MNVTYRNDVLLSNLITSAKALASTALFYI